VLVLTVAGLAPAAELIDAVGAVMGVAHDGSPVDALGADCAADCDAGCEKSGCHPGQHHCGCCAPMPRVAMKALRIVIPSGPPATWLLEPTRAVPSEGVAPPREPPRA
jgi:hypothetical protein